MSYTQLTREQRYQIYALKKAGHLQVEIARVIGVNKSTISRELSRNTGLRSYRPKQAHRFAMERRQAKAKPRITSEDWHRIEVLLRQGWSPDQVGCRLELESRRKVSHERIYQHIYADKRAGGELYTVLRCQKQRKKRYGSNDRRGKIPNRTGIEMRPTIVDDKSRIGDWEGDTIIGKGHKGAVVSLVERKSMFICLAKVGRKTARLVADAEIRLLSPLKEKVHTITKDNGLEFCDHARVAEAINADIYFARPYASNERGLNENANGLVRQYLPKSRRFDTVTDAEIDLIAHRLNHRPRKTLGYRTPYEVFFNTKTQLTGVALGN
ncbi:IS30 family transposase [Mariprofundus erugo]|uniref:IS30 family transposase n=1 Tax=Mariprofundus erugo TaxID=2528639 RepID=UPI0010FD787D|nr:IS30 family transposase [Mariprofundus erugo]TLS76913.1 IS30 family transposase [Mariprofundus erugo]